MGKKNITILKTTSFFHAYPIMLFLQHNNLSVKEWSELRINIKGLDNVNMLILQNSVIKNIILTQNINNKEMLQSMFQGPCLALGCLNLQQLIKLMKILKEKSKILTLGAIVDKQILTHLDLNKLTTLDNTVYNSLLGNFFQSNILYNTLQDSLNFEILQQKQMELISCLSFWSKA